MKSDRKFKFCNTDKFLYQNCSKRIKDKMKDKNVKQKDIYPKDKSLISNIVNCKCTDNNPYLITESVVESFAESGEKVGLIPILGFEEYELFWGCEDEIRNNSRTIFRNLILDLLVYNENYRDKTNNKNNKIDIDLDSIFLSYIPYTVYSTYKKIADETSLEPIEYFGIALDKRYADINKAREAVIEFLYLISNQEKKFENSFIKFTKNRDSFEKIDKYLIEYISLEFIPLLNDAISKDRLFGLIIKNLIESVTSRSKDLIIAYKNNKVIDNAEFIREQINSTSSYIVKLEDIQEAFIKKNLIKKIY